MDDRSHFICSLLEGPEGRFEVMVDGKVTSSDELTEVFGIPEGSTLVLGKDTKHRSFRGSIGGVNIWSEALDKHAIVSMYRGHGDESGNVLSWHDLRSVIPEELLPLRQALHLEGRNQGIFLASVCNFFVLGL